MPKVGKKTFPYNSRGIAQAQAESKATGIEMETGEGVNVARDKALADKEKPGLYANINAKKKRIAGGSKEKMRKPGSAGAPSAKDFKNSAKTAKKPSPKPVSGKKKVMKFNFLRGNAKKGKTRKGD